MMPTFFFFLGEQGPPTTAGYQHCLISLAEGLQALGIEFWANCNYWWDGGAWLFRREPDVDPEDCDVLVASDEYYGAGGRVPTHLLTGRHKTVFLDASDGWRTQTEKPYFRGFDLVLRTHYNDRYRYPANVHPWAFGLTNRVIQACTAALPFRARSRQILVNFRASHPVRRVARDEILPRLFERFSVNHTEDEEPSDDGSADRRFWEATGRRHYPGFYRRLGETMACAAFGGYFAPGFSGSTEALLERVLYAVNWRIGGRTHTVMQFDSWRFWESLCAGCLTLHVDLGRYGCSLPQPPQSLVHYLGFEFSRNEAEEFIMTAGDDELSRLAQAGRAWALEHYAPVPTARRLVYLLHLER